MRAAQHQAEFHHVWRICDYVIGTALNRRQNYLTVSFIAERHKRGREGYARNFVYQTQAPFGITLRAGRTQVKHRDITLGPKIDKFLEVEFTASFHCEAVPKSTRQGVHET